MNMDLKTLQDICPDNICDRLEVDVTTPPSMPDQRRRWALKTIDRIRVTEMALQSFLKGNPVAQASWARTVEQSIARYTRHMAEREEKIRRRAEHQRRKRDL